MKRKEIMLIAQKVVPFDKIFSKLAKELRENACFQKKRTVLSPEQQ